MNDTFTHKDAQQFIQNLHYITDVPNATQASLNTYPYKQVITQNRIELPPPTYNSFKSANNILETLSNIFWASYACHKIRIDSSILLTSLFQQQLVGINPRFVTAAGGACYPTQIYIHFGNCAGNDASSVISNLYYYSSTHHALISIQQSNTKQISFEEFSPYSVQLILTVNFFRTSCKYYNFSYRLTAVDLGLVLGRITQLLKALQLEFTVELDFNGANVDRFLQLKNEEEASYAIINITNLTASAFKIMNLHEYKHISKSCYQAIDPQQNNRRINPRMAYQKMNHLAQHEKPAGPIPKLSIKNYKNSLLNLSAIYKAIERRSSSAPHFTGSSCDLRCLKDCLFEMINSYQRIQNVTSKKLPTFNIYCLILNVKDILPGIYSYEANTKELKLIEQNDFSIEAQEHLRLKTVNNSLASFIIHIAGTAYSQTIKQSIKSYRIQQIVLGAMVDAASLIAAHYQYSAHPYLGFITEKVSTLYKTLPSDQLILAQLSVGSAAITKYIETTIYKRMNNA